MNAAHALTLSRRRPAARHASTVAATLVLALGWEALARIVASPALPGPLPAVRALVDATLRGPILLHLAVSLLRIVAAVGWALALGFPLGMVMGRWAAVDRFLAPLVYLLYPIPKVALLPVLIVLMGLGDTPKVFLIGIILLFQLVLTVRDGVRQVSPLLIRSVRSLGGGEWAVWRNVLIPAVLPSLFTSLRVGVGTAVSVLFLTESFVTERGIGYYLIDSWSRLGYSEMFAAVIGMALLGLLLYGIVDALERRLCPWARVSH